MAQDVIVLTEQELMTSSSLKNRFYSYIYIYFNLLNCMTIKQGCSILTTALLNDVSGQ